MHIQMLCNTYLPIGVHTYMNDYPFMYPFLFAWIYFRSQEKVPFQLLAVPTTLIFHLQ